MLDGHAYYFRGCAIASMVTQLTAKTESPQKLALIVPISFPPGPPLLVDCRGGSDLAVRRPGLRLVQATLEHPHAATLLQG